MTIACDSLVRVVTSPHLVVNGPAVPRPDLGLPAAGLGDALSSPASAHATGGPELRARQRHPARHGFDIELTGVITEPGEVCRVRVGLAVWSRRQTERWVDTVQRRTCGGY